MQCWVKRIDITADFIKECGLHTIRAGSFKPRTSPYSFQGMGVEGLKTFIYEIRNNYGFPVVTEVRDFTHIDNCDWICWCDTDWRQSLCTTTESFVNAVKQIKPILLKRGFGSTLQDLCRQRNLFFREETPAVYFRSHVSAIRVFLSSRISLVFHGHTWLWRLFAQHRHNQSPYRHAWNPSLRWRM